jgi:iron complex outermembrane receptor protein
VLAGLPSNDENRMVTVRVRLTEAGNRTSQLVSTGQRYVMGLTGMLADWDYEVASTTAAAPCPTATTRAT